MLLSSPATTACWPEHNSLRGRCTKGREGGSRMRAGSDIVVDRAFRSHSTSPLPPFCTPATQASAQQLFPAIFVANGVVSGIDILLPIPSV